MIARLALSFFPGKRRVDQARALKQRPLNVSLTMFGATRDKLSERLGAGGLPAQLHRRIGASKKQVTASAEGDPTR